MIERTHWDGCWKSGPEHYECAVGEVERLKADAERYRWLRGEVHGPRVPLAQVLWKLNNIRDNFRWTNLSDGQTLDEHIDAARERG